MKKLLLSLIATSLLLSPSAYAEDNTKKKHNYHVKIVQQQGKKKGWGVVALWVGGFIFDVIANATANTDSVKKVAEEVEDYINNNGIDQEKIAHKFQDRLKISLIQSFNAQNSQTHVGDAMRFNIQLKQKAYTYLLNISQDQACLIFPNDNDRDNRYSPQNHTIPANRSYQLRPDRVGRESLYLITSLRPLDFDKFQKTGIYRCTSRGKGLQKLGQIEKKALSDSWRVDVEVR